MGVDRSSLSSPGVASSAARTTGDGLAVVRQQPTSPGNHCDQIDGFGSCNLGVCREYGITSLTLTVRAALGSGTIGSQKPEACSPDWLPSGTRRAVFRSPRMAFSFASSGHRQGSA